MSNEHEVRDTIIALVVLFVIILGVRLLWAKIVYKDFRCAFADCRIIK